MQIEDLVWFSAVAKMGSISAAATTLGISQPTLSKAMARLEHSTRTPLLTRQARGVKLTPFGLVMRDYAQRLELTMGDMMAQLRDMRQGKGGLLRWGIGAGVPNDWVLDACSTLHADGIALEIVGGMTDVLMQELLQGSLDVLLLGTPGGVEPPAKWQRLASDPMQPIAPLAHPFARERKLSLQQFAQASWLLPGPQTFTRKDFDACFQRAGLTPPQPAVSSRSSQRDLVLAKQLGLLMTLPQSLTQSPEVLKDFRILPVPTQWQSRRELGFVWRGDGYRNPLIKRCIKLVQQTAKS
jgi:LysR family transcriptional regulator, regulator of abg operon